MKGQVVIRLAEVVAGRRRKQAKRASEEQRVVTSVDGMLVTTLGVVISDGKDFEKIVATLLEGQLMMRKEIYKTAGCEGV